MFVASADRSLIYDESRRCRRVDASLSGNMISCRVSNVPVDGEH